MKKLSLIAALGCLFMGAAANAADITLYYSPTCGHCHNAREFMADTLVYEYPTLNVTAVNVLDGHMADFEAALKKCEYTSGGVPVLVIGDKCFQGYGAGLNDELRRAVEADMSDADIATAKSNRDAMKSDADKFKSENANRANVITERAAGDQMTQKKNDGNNVMYFYILLGVLVLGLGFIILRKPAKK